MLLRSLLSKNWPRYLDSITKNLNSRSLPSLGGLKPNSVNDKTFDPDVDEAKEKAGIPDTLLTFEQKRQNQVLYEKSKKNQLQVGTYVYASLRDENFYKSFDIQRGTLYIIRRVDASEKIPVFYLNDLLGKPVKGGTFYKEELVIAQKPTAEKFFNIEAILKTKVEKGKKFALVKFQGYDNRFNEWIPESNLIHGDKT